MLIEVQRNETSTPIIYKDAISSYTKGPLFCVLFVNTEGKRVTHKYPLCSLFRVIEDYEVSTGKIESKWNQTVS